MKGKSVMEMRKGTGSSGKKTDLNVIYIVLDDVGYSALGYYGSEIETPHIDSLAEKACGTITLLSLLYVRLPALVF